MNLQFFFFQYSPLFKIEGRYLEKQNIGNPHNRMQTIHCEFCWELIPRLDKNIINATWEED